MNLLVIAIGGAFGALARHGLSQWVHRGLGGAFPYGTFVVNVVGCLAFGALVGLGETRWPMDSPLRAFWLVGVLGAFTTFSTYSFDNLALIRAGSWTLAALNAVGQLALGLAALWGGYVLARGNP